MKNLKKSMLLLSAFCFSGTYFVYGMNDSQKLEDSITVDETYFDSTNEKSKGMSDESRKKVVEANMAHEKFLNEYDRAKERNNDKKIEDFLEIGWFDNDDDFNQVIKEDKNQESKVKDSKEKSKTQKQPTTLLEAVDKRNSNAIKRLVEGGYGVNNTLDSEKNTALHLAAKNGYLLGVKTLIGLGADLSLRNKTGRTPLEEVQRAMKNKKLSSGQKNRLYWAGKLLEKSQSNSKSGQSSSKPGEFVNPYKNEEESNKAAGYQKIKKEQISSDNPGKVKYY